MDRDAAEIQAAAEEQERKRMEREALEQVRAGSFDGRLGAVKQRLSRVWRQAHMMPSLGRLALREEGRAHLKKTLLFALPPSL